MVLLLAGAGWLLALSAVIQLPGLGNGSPMALRLGVAACALAALGAVVLAWASFHPTDAGSRTWGMLALGVLFYVLGYAASLAEVTGALPRTETLGTAEVLWLGGIGATAVALYGNMLHLNIVLGGRGLVAAIVLAIIGGMVIAGAAVWPLTRSASPEVALGHIPDAIYLVLCVAIAIPAVVVPLQMGQGTLSRVWIVFSLSLLVNALADFMVGWDTTAHGSYTRWGAELYMLGYLGMGAAAAVQWGLNGAPLRLRRGTAAAPGSGAGVRRRSGRGAPGRVR